MKFEKTAKRILKAMSDKNLRAQELAVASGVSKASISQYINGSHAPSNISAGKLAAVLNVSPVWLMGFDVAETHTNLSQYGLRPVRRHKVPLLGPIACGTPIYAEEQYDAYVDSDVAADFCLTAKGDSMINAKIYDGDIVFIKEMSMVDDGDIAAVIIDDEATLKRVYFDKHKDVLTLVAENPKYAPMVYSADDAKSVRILGKALMVEHWL